MLPTLTLLFSVGGGSIFMSQYNSLLGNSTPKNNHQTLTNIWDIEYIDSLSQIQFVFQ